MSKDNIGYIKCPIAGKLSVVRRDKRGSLYYLSDAGKIHPALLEGQDYILANAVLWEGNKQPDNVKISIVHSVLPPRVQLVETQQVAESPTLESSEETTTPNPPEDDTASFSSYF